MFFTKPRPLLLHLSHLNLKRLIFSTRMFENNNPINNNFGTKRFIKSYDQLDYSIDKE